MVAETMGGRLLPAEAGFRPAELSGLRKAAVLMVAVGDEIATTMLKLLSEDDVRRVTNEILSLGDVPGEQLTQVLTEFYGLMEMQASSVRGGEELASEVFPPLLGLRGGLRAVHPQERGGLIRR